MERLLNVNKDEQRLKVQFSMDLHCKLKPQLKSFLGEEVGLVFHKTLKSLKVSVIDPFS